MAGEGQRSRPGRRILNAKPGGQNKGKEQAKTSKAKVGIPGEQGRNKKGRKMEGDRKHSNRRNLTQNWHMGYGSQQETVGQPRK